MSLMRWASGTKSAIPISSHVDDDQRHVGLGVEIGEDERIDRREECDEKRHRIDDGEPAADGARIAGGAQLGEGGERAKPGEQRIVGRLCRHGTNSLSSPGTWVWLRQPEHKLDGPGDPVTTKLTLSAAVVFTGFPLSRE